MFNASSNTEANVSNERKQGTSYKIHIKLASHFNTVFAFIQIKLSQTSFMSIILQKWSFTYNLAGHFCKSLLLFVKRFRFYYHFLQFKRWVTIEMIFLEMQKTHKICQIFQTESISSKRYHYWLNLSMIPRFMPIEEVLYKAEGSVWDAYTSSHHTKTPQKRTWTTNTDNFFIFWWCFWLTCIVRYFHFRNHWCIISIIHVALTPPPPPLNLQLKIQISQHRLIFKLNF